MANQYLDNFSLSGNFGDYSRLWYYQEITTAPSGGNFTASIGQVASFGKAGMTVSNNGYGTSLGKFLLATLSAKQVFMGMRVVTATNYGEIFLIAPNFAINASLTFNSDNSLTIYNAAGAAVATTPAQTVIPGVNCYLEIGCVSDPTVGSITVRVNGSVVAQAFNTNTDGSGSALTAGYGFQQSSYSSFMSYTDLYVNDASGTSWNTFMGDISVQTILPTAASVSQLTPNGLSTNVANASQIGPNPANNNSTTVAGQRDIYVGNPLATDTESVLMVVQRTMAYTTPGGTHSFDNIVIVNGTEVDNPPHNMISTNECYEDRLYVDPSTGGALSVARMNTIQFGVGLVS